MSVKELPTIKWPEDWRNVPLWAMFDRVKDVGHPDEEMLSVYRGYGVIKKSSRDDNTNQTAENRNIYQLIDEGWLIVNRMKAWQGSVGISPLRGIVSGHYICFRPRHSEDSRFLNQLLRSDVYTLEYARMSRGVRPGQIEIDNDELHGLRIILPPLEEQHRIADFLDRETSQIDALIDAKRRMRNLLEERDSVAFERVIKDYGFTFPDNLQPHWANASTPAGWKIMRLSQILDQLTNGYVGPTRDILVDSGVPYIQSLHIKNGHIDFSRREFFVSRSWHNERPRIHLLEGDVLIVQTGDIGQVAVVPEGFGEASCHALQIARVNRKVMTGPYLGSYLRSFYGYHSLLSRATGALHPHLEAGIRDIPVVVPPLGLQGLIVEEVRRTNEEKSGLRSILDAQTQLLQERRQALITAAVTGQIDIPEAA